MYDCILLENMCKTLFRAVFFSLCSLCFVSTQAQTIMRLKKPMVYYTGGYGVLATSGGYLLSNKVTGLSKTDLALISINQLSSFNRGAARQYSTTASTFSYVSAISTAALPTLMSLHKNVRSEFYTYNTVYAQAMLSTVGQVLILKSLVKKKRPFLYGDAASIDERTKADAIFSFPSGHTAIAATACFYGAVTYGYYFPKSKYKPLVWAGAVVLPLVTGYLRYKSGKHFVSDIAAGYAIGAANGIVFPLLFRVGNKK